MLLALPANYRLGRKGFVGANTKAYLATSSMMKKKSLIKMNDAWGQFYNAFFCINYEQAK
jgi:hypothetical protein